MMPVARTRGWPIAVVVLAIVALVAGVSFFRWREAANAPHPAATAFYGLTLADASGTPQPMAVHRGKVVDWAHILRLACHELHMAHLATMGLILDPIADWRGRT